MASGKQHDYHLIDPSPWPLTASLSTLVLAIGAIIWLTSLGGGPGVFGLQGPMVFAVGLSGLLLTAYMWWRDVIIEAHRGDHTPVVQLHLRYGMILFIASEVMFFVAWFWAYFDHAFYPAGTFNIPNVSDTLGLVQRNSIFGGVWPPVPVEATDATIAATGAPAGGFFKGTFDPWGLPLVNTLILLLSGCTVTWAHHALLKNDRRGLVIGLLLTVLLGGFFTYLQAIEYGHASFTFGGHSMVRRSSWRRASMARM